MITAKITAEEAQLLDSAIHGGLFADEVGEQKEMLEDLRKRGLVYINHGPEEYAWDDTGYYEVTSKGRLEINIFEKQNPGWRLK